VKRHDHRLNSPSVYFSLRFTATVFSTGEIMAAAQDFTAPTGAYPDQFRFKKLVADIIELLGPSSGIDSADVDPQDLIGLMRGYDSKEEDWESFAWGDNSRNYTRNLVDKGNGKSNLVGSVSRLMEMYY
jgi:hypothetical protein